MEKILSCEEVNSLLSLYIDNNLDAVSANSVQKHLVSCPACNQKYSELKNFIDKIYSVYKNLANTFRNEKFNNFNIKEYEFFNENLSCYIDNELTEFEKYKFESLIPKIYNSHNKINKVYLLKFLLQNNYKCVRNEFKENFSKKITSKLKREKEIENNLYALPKVALFLGLITILGVHFFNLDMSDEKIKLILDRIQGQFAVVKNR